MRRPFVTSRFSLARPALWISTSIDCRLESSDLASGLTCPISDKSEMKRSMWSLPDSFAISALASSPRSLDRPTITTCAPSLARPIADSLPTPAFAPVMIQTLFSMNAPLLQLFGFLATGEGRMSFQEFGSQHLEVVEGPEHLDAFVKLMGAAMAAVP
ncbi:MAG: hypothetical protein ACI9OJ_005385 [Myxococcota bacterium]|jgi:hypothetical protein